MVDLQIGAGMNVGQLRMTRSHGILLWAAVAFCVLSSPLLFLNLTEIPVRLWDESRLASNALEMYFGGFGIVTTYDGAPDLWNTKPPLLIWLQVLMMHVFGPGELALRLPSATAAMATCLVLLAIAHCYLRSTTLGLLSALILVTSPGFAGLHAARTGDYDALLTLLTTLACLSFFLHLETEQPRYLYGFFGFLSLGILTKGVGAVLFLPVLAVYTVFRHQLLGMLRRRHVYIGLLVTVLLVGGWYGLRELHGPGYLASVYHNELGGRYLNTLERHNRPLLYYLTNLTSGRMSIWWVLVPVGMALGLVGKPGRETRLIRFSTLLALTYLAVITRSETKCPWYDVPVYPFLALIAAAFVVFVVRAADGLALAGRRNLGKSIFLGVFLISLFYTPYQQALKRARHPAVDRGFYRIGASLRDAIDGRFDASGLRVPTDQYAPQTTFYIKILQQRGVDVSACRWEDPLVGDRVLANRHFSREKLAPRYTFVEEDDVGEAQILLITGP